MTHVLQTSWDAVENVIDCPLTIVESSPQSSHALLTRETHTHKLLNLSLVLLVLRSTLRLLLLGCLLLLLLFLLLLFLFGGFDLGFFLGLGCGFGDLVHADDEVGVFDAYFFDGFVGVEGFAFEDHFEGLRGHAFDFLYFLFEGGDLSGVEVTVSVGYSSIWKTSPLRFLMLSFIES